MIAAAVLSAGLTCVIGGYVLNSHLQEAGLQAPWMQSARRFAIDDQGLATPINDAEEPVAPSQQSAAPAEKPPAAPTTAQPPDRPAPAVPVLYVGEGCPHCEKVEEFLGSESMRDRVRIQMKEVFRDKANADEMLATAEKCGISKASVGVPLLWTGSECLSGDGPIIDFLKQIAVSSF